MRGWKRTALLGFSAGGGCLPPAFGPPEDIWTIWKLGGGHQAFDEAFENVAAVITAQGWVI